MEEQDDFGNNIDDGKKNQFEEKVPVPVRRQKRLDKEEFEVKVDENSKFTIPRRWKVH